MGFLAFGRRRRSGDSRERDRKGGSSDAAIRRPVLPLPEPEAPDAEAEIPRWRRQSLMAARRSAGHPGVAAEHLRFDAEAQAAVEGFERRLIRYRLVSLLDVPDEVRGTALGTLDMDDEVVVLERRGGFCCVLSPDGLEGWIHRMTLGKPMDTAMPAEADADAEPEPREDSSLRHDLDPVSCADRRARLPSGSGSAPCAAPGCAGARCSGRTSADSRTAAGACRPGTRRCRPWARGRLRPPVRRGPRP